MNGSPKPVIQYQLAEQYCLGNSKTGHPKERFSEQALSLKNRTYRQKTVHANEWLLESFFENFNM
jgi:hypothetical protein